MTKNKNKQDSQVQKHTSNGKSSQGQKNAQNQNFVSRSESKLNQLNRLGDVMLQVEELNSIHGQPSTDGINEQVGPTLEDSLKRVEYLLKNTVAHFKKAAELETAGKVEMARLASQRTEQDEEIRVKRKKNDDDIERYKKLIEDELTRKQLDLEQERELLRVSLKGLSVKERAVFDREQECKLKDAEFADRSARLTERELNAENGFAVEKLRIFGPVEAEVARLCKERDQLNAELAEARRKCEEQLREKVRDQALKWAEEDAKRTQAEAEERRKFDAEMTQKRREMLDALRALLASEREKAEAALQADLAFRTAALNDREAALDARDMELRQLKREHYSAQLDLRTEQLILSEDRAALNHQVDRLVAERVEDLRHEINCLKMQLEDARTLRDTYFKDLESRRELDRRFGGRTPEEILSSLTAAEHDRDTFAQQLRERLDVGATERLHVLEHQSYEWLEERAVLQSDLAKANADLATRRLAAIELETLRKEKEALEIHKQLLDGAVDELRARVDELTRQEEHRNPMTALASLDEQQGLQEEVKTTSPFKGEKFTLKEFANNLRHQIAMGVEGRVLYYTERDVRAFLGGLAMTRLMLLQGISGTGKTSLPLAFANAVNGGSEVVEVQAGWRDRQDLIGYYNAFHRHYYATNFLQALYKAGTPAYRDRLFMMVLDEVNLSRPEQFFADFLSALEQPMEKRRLTLVNDPVAQAPRLILDGRHLPIPPNVWFIGTANHDESTAEFADKTYDRAHVMEMPRKTDAAHFKVEKRNTIKTLSYKSLEEAFNAAAENQKEAIDKATNWLRSASFADDLQKRFHVGWGNRLENQMSRYLPVVVESGGSIGEAMDHLIVTKILRKLKDRHDVRAANLDDLSMKIQDLWDKLDKNNPPERCVALIEHEIAAKMGEELV